MKCATGLYGLEATHLKTIAYIPGALRDRYQHQEEKNRRINMNPAGLKRSLQCLENERATEVLKIQQIWRGFRGRKSIAHYLGDRRLWVAQRVADSHRRLSLRYLVMCFFGRGPLLESDSFHEAMLKKFPIWSHRTIEDIVQGQYY